ncbi:alpha/beta fold hydrolase [Cystobacter ferrugineus]|uniref:alpha/beta fold hydrolase n=1 Tax=Cystobacter ferrugineus TaxID=83449 RepID=UPI000AA54EE7|nr:alpha/beta hydrolase [Cystobacter ferrugineus]
MCLDSGAEAVRADPKGFARIQWDTWSPPGWLDDSEFEETAKSFANPDWADVTLNAYRWRLVARAVRPPYDALQERLRSVETLGTPTLMLQGGADSCDAPADSEGQEKFFTGPHQRLVLNGVGHFPAREASGRVADAVLAHLGSPGRLPLP